MPILKTLWSYICWKIQLKHKSSSIYLLDERQQDNLLLWLFSAQESRPGWRTSRRLTPTWRTTTTMPTRATTNWTVTTTPPPPVRQTCITIAQESLTTSSATTVWPAGWWWGRQAWPAAWATTWPATTTWCRRRPTIKQWPAVAATQWQPARPVAATDGQICTDNTKVKKIRRERSNFPY